MKELAQLLNEMMSSGVIDNYALFGAVAQMRYTEAVATIDADLLIAVPSHNGLVCLKLGRGLKKNSPMNNEMDKWFEKKARWQHGRGTMLWSEKIRLVEQIRESIKRWSQSATKSAGSDSPHSQIKNKES